MKFLYPNIGWAFLVLSLVKSFDSSHPTTLAAQLETKPSSTILMEICDNGIDDDGDGLIDCFDDDCFNTMECEGFYYGSGASPCSFTPTTLPEFELELIYTTDKVNYPIDQRNGAFVGDMDGDGIPEIIGKDPNPGRIQIFNGVDGTIKQSIVAGNSSAFGMPAIADVDLDGKGDIFIMESGNRLARYEYDSAAAIWKTANNIGDNSTASTPEITDFDGDGVPEVYVGNRVFNSIDGTRLAIGAGNRGGYNSSDKHPIAYDIFEPGDPKPGGGVFGAEVAGLELIAGSQVYSVELGNGTMDNGALTVVSEITTAGLEDGFTSIADIDGDGEIDIIVMDSGKIYVWNPRTEGQIGTTYTIADTNGGGRINIGDFDNDGMVEIGTAGKNIYVVLEYNSGTNVLEEKWKKTGLDDGSQRTGSTLFDFEGDGINEVVYSEEASLYIWKGTDGSELIKIATEAGTRSEYPVVADVNADGAAEIIVTSQDGNGPGFSGADYVRVYRSKNNPWVSARPVWNQHGYYNTNINDDLSVPLVPQSILDPSFNNAFNGFLVQSTILSSGSTPAFAATDATMEILDVGTDNCPDILEIEMKVKNIGDAILPGGTPIAFYNGSPTMSAVDLFGTTTLPSSVAIDDSITFTYSLNINPFLTPLNVYAVVNDTGFMMADLPYDLDNDFPVTGTAECDFTNNTDHFGNIICLEVCGDGIDNDGDGLADEPNITAPDTTGCSGDVLAQMTTDLPAGTWSIISTIGSTIDANGNVTLGTNISPIPVTDTVVYTLPPCNDTVLVTTVDDVPPSLTCPGNHTAPADADCEAVLENYLDDIIFSDNCSANANIDMGQSPMAGTTLMLGSTTVTIKVADEAGNDTNCSFVVTVTDFINPTITCPFNTIEDVDAGCNFTIGDYTGGATVDDNCSDVGDISITQFPPSSTLISGDGFTQNVILTAEDEAGNTESCLFIITLEDNLDPTVVCPANQEIPVDADCEAIIPDYRGLATISDNCVAFADLTITQTPLPNTMLMGAGTTANITVSVDDGNGNSAQCVFVLELKDETPPSITCPTNMTIDVDADCEFSIIDYTGDATVNDNCADAGDISIDQNPIVGTVISGDGTVQTVTIQANDGNGNTAQCTFNITLNDDTAPSITCPSNSNVSLNANCETNLADYTSSSTVDDNCTLPIDISVSQSPAAGALLTGHGTMQVVTLTADDGNGNTMNCDFTITLIDDTDPSIVCPSNQLLSVDAMCQVALPDFTGSATIDDNCTLPTNINVTQTPAIGTILSGDGTMQTITLTADDGNGNTAQCTFDIELNDATSPTITCPGDKLVDVDADCEYTLADYTAEPNVTSYCDVTGMNSTVSQSPASGTLLTGHNTMQVVTLTAEDMMGNTNSCTFTITLQDVDAPMIDCPADITLDVDGDCEITLADYTGNATVSDNCTPPVNINVTQTPIATTTFNGNGTIANVMLTADDGNGNMSQCDFSITLNDNTPPTVSCPANTNIAVDGGCNASIADYTGSAMASDNCTVPTSISVSQTPLAGFIINGSGVSQTVTLTADDGNGNTATCDFTVTTNDGIAPVITCPSSQSISVNGDCETNIADYTMFVVVSDNCSAVSNIDISQVPAAATTLSGHGTMQTITLTAEDENGNTAICDFEITLNDFINPTITCPADAIVNVDASCEIILADYTSSATIDDNCADMMSISVTQNPNVGITLSGHGTIQTVTLFANDGNGNSASCNFNVTLNDDTDPSITCPANVTEDIDNNCNFEINDYTILASANDNCTANADIAISQTPTLGTIINGSGTMQTVTITADDGNGNTASCNFEITLNDDIDPVIVCPGNQSINLDGDCETLLADYTSSGAISDNCTAPTSISVSQMPAIGTMLSGHNTMQVVTLTADDGNGNTATCDFTVTLIDAENPSILCPPNQTLAVDGSCEVMLPDYSGLSIYEDNCTLTGNITISQTPAIGTVFTGHNITNNVTLTADDGNGNTASCTFSFTLDDDTPPVPNCPANQTLNPDADCEIAIPDYTSTTLVTDNCTANGAISLSQIPNAGTVLSGDGTMQTITIIADDGNGNTAQCTFDVTLTDILPPTIDCPFSPQTINVDDNCSVPLPDYTGSVSATDNCNAPSQFTVTQTPVAGTMVNTPGTTINVEITVNDGNGNNAICNFDVLLVDNNDPSLTCPGDQTLYPDVDCEATIPDYTGIVSVTNQCMMGTGITLTQDPIANTVLMGHGTSQLITITADDGNGNMETCDFTVTLNDTLPPSITCPINLTEDVDDNCLFEIIDYTSNATVADNCTADMDIIITQDPAAGITLSGDGTSQDITLTADDGNGNTTSCVFNLTINDNLPPSIICPPDEDITLNDACEANVGEYTSLAIFTDNCATTTNITVTQLPISGTVIMGHNTVQTITLTADDGNGNTENCTFDLSLLDETNPTILCPADMTIDVDSSCEYDLGDFTGDATVMDNCTADIDISVSQTSSNGSTLTGHNFSQTVTLTADDGNGNTISCDFEITLNDAINPMLSCPADITIDVDSNCEMVLDDYTSSAAFSDNCAANGAITLSQSPLAGSSYSGHSTSATVTLTADDGNGNSAQCTFIFTLNDVTDPTITCPAMQSVLLDADCEAALPDYSSFVILDDNCTDINNINVTQVPAAGTMYAGSDAMETVTLTANDGNGNLATCNFTVEFQDVTMPPLVCPTDFLVDVNSSCEYTLQDYTAFVTTSSECGNEGLPTLTQTPASGLLLSGHGTLQMVTITAEDEEGNTSDCEFEITLEDNIPPFINCPLNETISEVGCEQVLDDYTIGLFYNDNCSLVSNIIITQNPMAGMVLPSGTHSITLMAEDEAGNIGECSFLLNLNLTPPTVPIITGN